MNQTLVLQGFYHFCGLNSGVTSESAPPQMLDPSTNGEVAPDEAALPLEESADRRGKEPITSHRFSGRRNAIGQDEPGLFHNAVKPDQPEPPAGPNGVPRNNMAEDS